MPPVDGLVRLDRLASGPRSLKFLSPFTMRCVSGRRPGGPMPPVTEYCVSGRRPGGPDGQDRLPEPNDFKPYYSC